MISCQLPQARIPRWCLNAAVLLGSTGLLSSAVAAKPESQANQPATYHVDSENSVVFINGQYVVSPYQIQYGPDLLTVNGVRLEVAESRQSDRPESKGRNPGGGGPGGGGPAGFRNGGRRGFGGNGPAQRASFPEQAFARQLRERLRTIEIVIAFDHFPLRSVPVDGEGLSTALLAESRVDCDWDEILRPTGSAEEAAVWEQWLDIYQVPAEAKDRLLESISVVQQMEAESLAATAETVRLDRYAYPLTVLGMLLGVFAFGHMLQWAGNGLHQKDMSEESERYVILALGMMAGMAFIDFLWTVLAGQAGQMKEVNPLAANFIDSPAQLAIFKIVATGIGFAIIYFWRQRYQIQKVAWWMCLVCVLLTFRWVMFDSMRA